MLNLLNSLSPSGRGEIMKIKYLVQKVENAMGTTCVICQTSFSSVQHAIDYHKIQENGEFSWWIIIVEYE